MKRLILITLFLCLSNLIFAQLPNITKVEYYFDTDPGYNMASNVSLAESTDLDITFNPDISALTDGIHQLFVRCKDANDKWSLSKSHTFFKGFGVSKENISNAEYYFDTDPGYGNATAIIFTPSADVNVDLNINVSSLENGIHELYIRAKDAAGQWTSTKSHTFYKGIFSNGLEAKIIMVEYFYDADPGFGKGIKVPFTPGAELDLTFKTNLIGLTEDCHRLYIRAQDENESWSLIQKHPFCITPTGIGESVISKLLFRSQR